MQSIDIMYSTLKKGSRLILLILQGATSKGLIVEKYLKIIYEVYSGTPSRDLE